MKTVLITGGSEGLGYATAKLLSKNYNVYILSRTLDKLEEVSKELGCKYKVCDVSNWQEVEKAVSEIIEESKTIDILINNAGLLIQGPIKDNDPEKIKSVIEVNALGTILMTKAVAQLMSSQKSGIIINVISQAGLVSKAERSVYCASKWAITGFTKSMFHELVKDGIKVMGIYPSLINTNLFKKIGINKDMNGALSADEVAKSIEFMIIQNENTVITELGLMTANY